jgi:hypothetical protein
MSQIVDDLARRQLRVGSTRSFALERPDTELQRLSDAGIVLQLAKGLYALVPEPYRSPGTAWRPTIEGAALGAAATLHTPNEVALIGPSAARAHRCYPRALGTGYVAVPHQRRARTTATGRIRFVQRDVNKLDIVRIETDLGSGYATSIEQTALDLCRSRPDWGISDSTRHEMIQLLASRIDWTLIDEIARDTRGVRTLQRLRALADRPAT